MPRSRQSRPLCGASACDGAWCRAAEWHDYRQVDAIVALRGQARPQQGKVDAAYFSPERKPASKLTNAWLAGVPAILSPEVAFADLRRSELDYLEARSIPEMARALERLQQDTALRRAMIENGARRAADFTVARAVADWRSILEQDVMAAFERWVRSPARRRWLYLSRSLMDVR